MALFRQTMQNFYAVFGDNAARLYEISSRTNRGSWDTKLAGGRLVNRSDQLQVFSLAVEHPVMIYGPGRLSS